jgi:hypothetical protein
MFHLKHQLEHAKISQTHDSLHPSDDDDEDIANLVDVNNEDDDNDTLVDEDGVCDGKPDGSNGYIKQYENNKAMGKLLCTIALTLSRNH